MKQNLIARYLGVEPLANEPAALSGEHYVPVENAPYIDEIDALVDSANLEVGRLRSAGWTQGDFAAALKQELLDDSPYVCEGDDPLVQSQLVGFAKICPSCLDATHGCHPIGSPFKCECPCNQDGCQP